MVDRLDVAELTVLLTSRKPGNGFQIPGTLACCLPGEHSMASSAQSGWVPFERK